MVRQRSLLRSLRLRVPLARVLQAQVKQFLVMQVVNPHKPHSRRHELLQQPRLKRELVPQLWQLWATPRQSRGTKLRHRSRRRAPLPQRKRNLQPGHDQQIFRRIRLQRGLEHHLRHLQQLTVVGRC